LYKYPATFVCRIYIEIRSTVDFNYLQMSFILVYTFICKCMFIYTKSINYFYI